MNLKKVDREHLQHVANELISLTYKYSKDEQIQVLYDFFNDNVLEKDKDFLNEAKRILYLKMKTSKTPEENKMWYAFYQDVKSQT